MISFVQLTENDKRLIIMLFLVFIIVFVIIGYIGLLVKKIMTKQGEKADDLIHNVVVAGVIRTEGKLNAFGIRKNWRVLFKQAWLPFVIMLVSALVLTLSCVFTHHTFVDIFTADNGFFTLFHKFDWKNIPKTEIFGIKVISNFPPVLEYPNPTVKGIVNYIFVPTFAVGFIWYLVCVQAYIARAIQLRKCAAKVFKKSLKNYDPNKGPQAPIKPE